MEGVTDMMAWLGHVPGRCRGGVYGHTDPTSTNLFFSVIRKADVPDFAVVSRVRVSLSVAEMEAAVSVTETAPSALRSPLYP